MLRSSLTKKIKPFLTHLPKLATGVVILLTLLTFFEISPISVSGHQRNPSPQSLTGGCVEEKFCPQDYTTCWPNTIPGDEGYWFWMCPQNNASCNSTLSSGYGGPTTTTAGAVENFTFNMTNTSHDAWDPNYGGAYPYNLRYYIVDSNGTWQVSGRTPGLTTSIAAGALHGFNENITMPQTTGTHTLKWHMERSGANGPGQQVFGQQCERTITVNPRPICNSDSANPPCTAGTTATCSATGTKNCYFDRRGASANCTQPSTTHSVATSATVCTSPDTCVNGSCITPCTTANTPTAGTCTKKGSAGTYDCSASSGSATVTYSDTGCTAITATEDCQAACQSGYTCQNNTTCVTPPTNLSLTVNGVGTPNTVYATGKSGILSGYGGVGWRNPATVTVDATLQGGATSKTKYYAAIYSTNSTNFSPFIDGSNGNPVSNLQSLLTTDKKSGLVLKYEGGTPYVWNPWSNPASWQTIPTVAGIDICTVSSNCQADQRLYTVERTTTPGSWRVRFWNAFGSKNLYTAGKVVDNYNQEISNPDTQ